jgi:hypothetical protein
MGDQALRPAATDHLRRQVRAHDVEAAGPEDDGIGAGGGAELEQRAHSLPVQESEERIPRAALPGGRAPDVTIAGPTIVGVPEIPRHVWSGRRRPSILDTVSGAKNGFPWWPRLASARRRAHR